MKYGTLITLLFLVNIHSALGQQAETNAKSAEFYFNSGISVPKSHNNFAEFYDKSFNVGFGIGYDLSPSFLICFELAYNNFRLDGERFINSHENLKGTASEGDEAIYSFTVGTKARLSTSNDNIRPYLKVNFGFMHRKYEDLYVEAFDPDTSFVLPEDFDTSIMLHFGVGIDIKITKEFYLFGEAKLNHAFTKEESTQYIPLKVGILYRR